MKLTALPYDRYKYSEYLAKCQLAVKFCARQHNDNFSYENTEVSDNISEYLIGN